MSIKDSKFDAFISYRHAELDKFVAETLHKKLEAFRLPSSVRRKNNLSRDRIRRVFRDRDELPLASDLAEQITDALRNSEYLIVICTPRLPQSKWCLKEIDTFIQMHGRENIFAILAEGEPSESFPPQLIYTEETVLNSDNIPEVVRKPVEPLAADVRGKNKKEIRKKISEELLRLVAPMFGLNYDDLKQRHREQKMKRVLRLSFLISFVFLVFGIFSSVLSIKIQQQADEIYAQNEVISAQNDEILHQTELLQEQNVNLQKSHAFSMSLEADKLYTNARRLDALYALRSVMPDTLSDPEIPYTAQSQQALTNILGLYQPNNYYAPYGSYDVQSKVSSFRVSPEHKRILIHDYNFSLTLWNVNEGKPFKAFVTDDNNNPHCYDFIDDDRIVFNTPGGIYLYDCTTDQTTLVTEIRSNVYTIPGTEDIIIFTDSLIIRMDLQGNIVWSYDSSGFYYYLGAEIFFSEDRQYFYIEAYSSSFIFNTETGEPVATLPYEYVTSVTTGNNYLYAADTDPDSMSSLLYCFDFATGECIWTVTIPDTLFQEIVFCKNETDSYLFASAYDEAFCINPENGEVMDKFLTDGYIRNLTTSYNRMLPVFTTYNNEYLIYEPTSQILVVPDFLNHFKESEVIDEIYFAPGILFYYCLNARRVVSLAPSELTKDTEPFAQIQAGATMNTDATCYYTKENDTFSLYHVGETMPYHTIPLEGKNCRFAGGDSEFFILYDSNECSIYRTEDASLVRTIAATDNSEIYVSTDHVSEEIWSDDTITRVYSLYDPDTVYELTPQEYDLHLHKLCLSESTPYYALVNNNDGIIQIRHFEDSSIDHTIYTNMRTINYYTFSDDGKYLFVEHIDQKIEIYDTATGSLAQTLYDIHLSITSVEYAESLDTYFAYGYYKTKQFCLNADLEIVTDLPTLFQYDEDGNMLICTYGSNYYRQNFYSYEELIRIVDETLGDYEPSDEIRQKHNIIN